MKDIYFIRGHQKLPDGSFEPRLKIGMGKDAWKRIKSLSTALPGPPDVVAILKDQPDDAEKRLHYHFRRQREWKEHFAEGPITATIKKLKQGEIDLPTIPNRQEEKRKEEAIFQEIMIDPRLVDDQARIQKFKQLTGRSYATFYRRKRDYKFDLGIRGRQYPKRRKGRFASDIITRNGRRYVLADSPVSPVC